jgi:hypothetical protein
MYKLTPYPIVLRLTDNASIPVDPDNRDYQEYLKWLAAGNTPDPADEPTPEQIARDTELNQAPLTARQFFAANPAAVAFVRLTPEEQAAQLDGMTLAQTKTVIKYLVVAVSALIKEKFI